MPVYLLDDKVLLDGGAIATSEDCCCGDCTFCNLPGHVQGEITFSGVFCCLDGTRCTVNGTATLDDDFTQIVPGSTLGFFCNFTCGSVTISCDGASPCTDERQLEIEIYVQCLGDVFQIHIFTEFTTTCCIEDVSFAYNGGAFTAYTPPVTNEVFPLAVVGGTCCGGETCQGTATLTLTSGACCVGTDCSTTNRFCCENDLGGTFQGYGSDCTPDPCASTTGACCAFGTCFEVTEAVCTNIFHGTFLGVGTPCTPDPC